jgi:hypothetical protein
MWPKKMMETTRVAILRAVPNKEQVKAPHLRENEKKQGEVRTCKGIIVRKQEGVRRSQKGRK